MSETLTGGLNDYQTQRDKAFFGTNSLFSREILEDNPWLVFHPPVNPLGKKAHYTIFGEQSAICCTEEEALLLYKITAILRPSVFIEIGSYSGWSSVHILKALCPGAVFMAVDNFSENKAPKLVKTILLSQMKKFPNVFVFETDSTQFLNSLVTPKADIIFIDGFHRNGKPLEDTIAATKVLSDTGVILLHDTWMPDVKISSDWLVDQGFKAYFWKTDNYLAAYTKGDLGWTTLTVV